MAGRPTDEPDMQQIERELAEGDAIRSFENALGLLRRGLGAKRNGLNGLARGCVTQAIAILDPLESLLIEASEGESDPHAETLERIAEHIEGGNLDAALALCRGARPR
jgi:hypothetical protein